MPAAVGNDRVMLREKLRWKQVDAEPMSTMQEMASKKTTKQKKTFNLLDRSEGHMEGKHCAVPCVNVRDKNNLHEVSATMTLLSVPYGRR